MSTQNLLVEIFVEELPPKALKKLGDAFAAAIADSLKAQGLAAADAVVTPYASPRRLAVQVAGVAAQAADKPVSHKLMPVNVGLDANGKATPALLKRLAALGQDEAMVPNLKRVGEGKGEALFFDSVAKGATLVEGLQKALDESLTKLPIPKVMAYQLHENCEQPGWSTVNFVRPVHGLVALHGAEVVPVSVLGLTAGRATQGHRFEAAVSPVSLKEADSYAAQMENEGAVIASFEERRADIVRQLHEAAAKVGGVKPVEDDALLDEVTGLVERPNVLIGCFGEEFLGVPQECLILTMKANQKYFPLLDTAGKLSNQFLIVSNIHPADPSAVIGGNERVVRPRLADAKFFFDQDRKNTLASRVPKLGNVVYHNKLGTQLARTQRVTKLAGEIARQLNASAELAERAAHLAKADLLTDMVGEFPELQGIMGLYYALHDGEREEVARAIEQHYWPRFAGDALPQDNIGAAAALADKLDTLVGIYGIGLVPTGDKDPFGLRRHALGVLRILAESGLPLDLLQLLQQTRALFPAEMLADSVALDVHGFMLERLKGYLRDKGFAPDEIDAVVSQAPTRIDRVVPRLDAVQAFKQLPEAAALAAANKRIQNILKKAGELPAGGAELALMSEPAEKALFEAMNELAPSVVSSVQNGGYTEALTALAGVRTEVDTFFDQVMVMAEEPQLRNNRLALLKSLGELMNQVADISKLAS
ncbi:glycyl-tRNA synthetase, subunit beta [Sulfuricella denitrificans skB26]|uniref:Glycine--tRNA ligase beta subunit n=1 Tax=Sulfuricella denitrificans (strain DSM 22764 / NBRC 105220 / skB26) TaxID=1163617 RepID=S6AAY6_SULDS|nr:glycine--tRNA ligase subunit beta [Sulfuricella denitrificans]BAN36370.1 glycyl-tRNA synthetase, subunit beta [Sulfuricella denitrificans skB26]